MIGKHVVAIATTLVSSSALVLACTPVRDVAPAASASVPASQPVLVLAVERTGPGAGAREQSAARVVDVLARRGIAVEVVRFRVGGETLDGAAREVATFTADLRSRAAARGSPIEPMVGGQGVGATVAALAALAPETRGLVRAKGVVAISGEYDPVVRHAHAGAPPTLLLSAHSDSGPARAQSTRAFARALERAGANEVRAYHVASRTEQELSELVGTGERNEVGDVVASFVRREPANVGIDSEWAVADTWGARAPLSTEPFFADAKLVERHPVDARLRAAIGRVYAGAMRELEPWPGATYDAIDLDAYLRAHPELGAGEWLQTTNVRGERLVIRREAIARWKPVLVIGLDDERNLFRLLVTYNVQRTYSWRTEPGPRPLLARHLGAFLLWPDAAENKVDTLAAFALSPTSFAVSARDPLAAIRSAPAATASALTGTQGCVQCHTFRGAGARAHHLRARDGGVAEAFALPLEDYPEPVLRRFLFEQDQVAESFGVGGLRVERSVATALFEATRPAIRSAAP